MSNKGEGKEVRLTAIIESNPDDQRIFYKASCDNKSCEKRGRVLNCYHGEKMSLVFMDPPSDLGRCAGVDVDWKLIKPENSFKENKSIGKFVYESLESP